MSPFALTQSRSLRAAHSAPLTQSRSLSAGHSMPRADDDCTHEAAATARQGGALRFARVRRAICHLFEGLGDPELDRVLRPRTQGGSLLALLDVAQPAIRQQR